MVEAAARFEAAVERPLAGMAERRVAEVMRQRQCLGKILVKPERARERAGDLGDFEGVGEAGAEMIAFVEDEHLRLVRQAAKRVGMDDAVAVAAKGAPSRARRLRVQPAAAAARIAGIGSACARRFDRHAGPPDLAD